ncbi:Rv3654c family TadE-like protein [Leifsonia sp. McL0607]|uniref:Rv3654c family TadE-like protein n=1 Tax=Leifsonia sp. McL0607 TaxID=3415672 RepID=UPI003CE97DBB
MSGASSSPTSAERGSGTVLALATVAVLVAVTTAVMLVSGAWAARHRAAIAADAAALAAAEVAVGRAVGEPCAQARLVASANGAALAECAVAGVVVQVTAVVPHAGWQAEVPARAGPPGSP